MSGVELVWPGKYDSRGCRTEVPHLGAELDVEATHGREAQTRDRLLLGDNLAALEALCAAAPASVDLVYIDPPFATGGRFAVATRVGTGSGTTPAPEYHAPAYGDRFPDGAAGFARMLDPRLQLIHRLLAPRGSFYLHLDANVVHVARLVCDEVFGPSCFQRQIVWRIGWVSGFKTRARNWIRNHDIILFYTKDPRRFTFNKLWVPHPAGYRRRDGARPKAEGVPIDDVWNANAAEFALRGADSLDSIQIKSFSHEKSGYATQKNESLLRRIIAASSNPGDRVADLFCGSGTTGVVARALGRQFIGCDEGAAALHIARKRMLGVASERGLSVERVRSLPATAVASRNEHEPSDDPEPQLRLHVSGTTGPEIEIRGFEFGRPERVPARLLELVHAFDDLIDAWWVSLPERPHGVPHVVAGSFRTHRVRELSRKLGPLAVPDDAASLQVRVDVIDVTYRCTRADLRLEKVAGGWQMQTVACASG